MPRPVRTVGQRWTRLDRYEVVGGAIRPVPGAQLVEYDPWADYELEVKQSGPITPAYVSLFNIVKDVEKKAPVRRTRPFVSEATINRVTEWCCEHGLLGLLMHEVQAIRLSPGLSDTGMFQSMMVQRWHWRIPNGWKTQLFLDGDGEYDAPALLLSAESGRSPTWEPLSDRIGTFFPNVPVADRNSYRYPTPGTHEFWRSYCEPLSDFLQESRRLARAIRTLKELEKIDKIDDRQTKETVRASENLKVLLASTHPVSVLRDGRHELRWVSSSLLGMIALMATMDLLAGDAFLSSCRECGTFFRSSRSDALYCGKRCRSKAAKARAAEKRAETTNASPKVESRLCKSCKSTFQPAKPSQKYCTYSCRKREQMRRWRSRKRQAALERTEDP